MFAGELRDLEMNPFGIYLFLITPFFSIIFFGPFSLSPGCRSSQLPPISPISDKRALLQTTSIHRATLLFIQNTLHHHSTSPAWTLVTTWLAWWPPMRMVVPHPVAITTSSNFIKMITTGTISLTPRVRKCRHPSLSYTVLTLLQSPLPLPLSWRQQLSPLLPQLTPFILPFPIYPKITHRIRFFPIILIKHHLQWTHKSLINHSPIREREYYFSRSLSVSFGLAWTTATATPWTPRSYTQFVSLIISFGCFKR